MDDTEHLRSPKPFPQTSWSLVERCLDPADPAFRDSLDRLLSRYWRPVFFFVYRNAARDIDRARDLTQEFFVTFLEKDFLAAADRERGRFRNYVCVTLRRFLGKVRRAEHALKRRPEGGLRSLDRLREIDPRFEVPSPCHDDQEAQFDSDWRQAVVQLALAEVRSRATRSGKEVYVELFVRRDLEGRKATYDEMAAEAGLTTGQVTSGLHWARQQFRSILLDELSDQVVSETDLADEARRLFGLEIGG